MARPPGLLAAAGLVVGPSLWAASTQAGQILPDIACSSPSRAPTLMALAAAAASLAAAGLSWRAARSDRQEDPTVARAASIPFVGRLSALSGLLFAYALALQSIATLVLTGCER